MCASLFNLNARLFSILNEIYPMQISYAAISVIRGFLNEIEVDFPFLYINRALDRHSVEIKRKVGRSILVYL